MTENKCIHRYGDCHDLAPGISACRCGQVFVFVCSGGAGRYRKLEELTEEDKASFDPVMAERFRQFMGRRK